MLLLEYLKNLDSVRLADFAVRCNTTPGHLLQVARGYRRVGEYLCINIERETAGAIRCETLRPDVDWAYLRSTSVQENKAA